MSTGKRYDGEPKLNIKKVIMTILVLVVIIMLIVLLVRFSSGTRSNQPRAITNSYISVYTNGKWGVINSKGDIILNPSYDNMILVPDPQTDIFIVQTDVDLDNNTYTSIALNSKSERLFGNYDTVEAMQNIDANGAIFYDTNVLKVSKNGQYGLIDYKGTELLPCECTAIEPIKYLTNSFVTTKDNLKGVVDHIGSTIIDNEYTDIQALTTRYEDGYVVKNANNQYGLINYNKKQILECKYTEILPVTGNDMYVVREGTNLEVISNDGTVLINNAFTRAISIDTRNVTYVQGNNYGVMASDGTVLIKPEYQYLSYLYDGNYIAKRANRYGIINLLGEVLVDFNYTNIAYMKQEGFIEADKTDGQTDLINTEFEIKCTGIVSEINDSLSFVKLRVGDTYKYYNFRLEERQVKNVYPANTLLLDKQNGKYGFVDRNGIVVVDYIYDDATEQNSYGYVAVKKDGLWGAIDSTGKVAVEPQYPLAQNTVISFIGKWHLGPDINANYYTDVME